MTKSRLAILAATLITVASLSACKADHSAFPTLTVDQLSTLLDGDNDVTVLDANSSGVRDEYGKIPGAVLLTSYGSYDLAAELPSSKDSSLVFYCSSEMCSAAPKAAERAVDAGYEEVFVLPVGIKGWVKSGKAVENVSG